MGIRLKITRHANDKMMWLGITRKDIEKAITRGSKFKQTNGLLACYRYIRVAYKKIGEKTYKIKTVYVEA